MLLTRDEFRESVFRRDSHRCVACQAPAVDAHHIMERRLFDDGGYYLSNGASVCEEHHLACERTDISVESIRTSAKITTAVLPAHLYSDEVYDKWGNIVLPNGQRLRGELFYDESVQKIIADKLNLFTYWVKYPRTWHVPWSEGMNDDDRLLPDMSSFEGRSVLVTEKMDGENTTMYRDHIHARRVESGGHPSRLDSNTLYRPDLAFWDAPHWESMNLRKSGGDVVPPLVVEVQSPSETRASVLRKAGKYQHAGVHTTWAILENPYEVRVFETGREPRVVLGGQRLEAPTLLPGFSIDPSDLLPQ